MLLHLAVAVNPLFGWCNIHRSPFYFLLKYGCTFGSVVSSTRVEVFHYFPSFYCYLQLNNKRVDFNSTQTHQVVVTRCGCSPIGVLFWCAPAGQSLDGGMLPVTVRGIKKLTPLDGGFICIPPWQYRLDFYGQQASGHQVRLFSSWCTAVLNTRLSLDGGMLVTARGIENLPPLDGKSTLTSLAMTLIQIDITGACSVAVKSVVVVSDSLKVVIKCKLDR